MRKLDVLHFAAATAFAVTVSFAGAAPTQAAGLSAKQIDEISEFFKCKSYLLQGDLVSFEADDDCGDGPASTDLKSLASQLGDGGGEPRCSNGGGGDYIPPGTARTFMGGGYGYGCHDDYKPKVKKPKPKLKF